MTPAASGPALDPTLRLRIRQPGVAWKRLLDDMVLLDVDRSVYHGLNRTGALVWERLSSGATTAELVEHVVAAYPDSREEAARDVPVFVQALLRAGLVEVVDATEVVDAAEVVGDGEVTRDGNVGDGDAGPSAEHGGVR